MAKALRISAGLSLPLEAVSRTFGVLGQRGSGKSNAAVVMAEEMYRAGLHWVAIDPKGDWWGVRSSGDGKGEGLPVVIFGGAKADVPLEPTAGVQIADLVVGEGLSCVLDVSEFTEGEKIRFLAGVGREEGFAGRLLRKKNRDQDPTHLFLEEAHDYIPQRPFKDQAKLVHVFGKLVTMGRTRGLGATLVSQRSARIHKDVLTQVDTLIVLRTMGPQDRKAIEAWLEYHGEAKEILASLPKLADGEAWVWSPEWLGETKRIRFARRSTYDSGSTPVQGRTQRRPATLADVDLAAIEAQMKATIERARAEDPRELQKLLREKQREVEHLHRQISELDAAPANVETIVERVEVPVLTDAQFARLEKLATEPLDRLDAAFDKIREQVERYAAPLGKAMAEIEWAATRPPAGIPRGPSTGAAQQAGSRAPASPRTSPTAAGRGGPTLGRGRAGTDPGARPGPSPAPEGRNPATSRPRAAVRGSVATLTEGAHTGPDSGLSGPARMVLDAIAWWEVVGYPQPSKQQVGIIAGYRVGKRVGGHYGNILGSLKSAGLIEYPSPGAVVLTEQGRQRADVADVAVSTAALQAEVLSRCSGPERRILQVLIDLYPDAISKQELGARAGYEVGERVGGHFGNLLGRLHTLGLIDYPSPGWASADPVLFLEER